MPVPAAPAVNRYVGNGFTTVFAYGFRIFAAADLQVLLNGVPAVSGFTVSGVNSLAGGNVTFAVAPANGVSVTLRRVMAYERQTDYQNGGDLLEATLDADQDAPVMMIQQLAEAVSRALAFPPDSPLAGTLPTPQAARFLRWNALGNGLENADVGALGGIGLPVPLSQGGTNATTAQGALDNLTSGTGRRIRGQMSDGTRASRLAFQTNGTDPNTAVQAIPNTGGAQATFIAFSAPDPDNASLLNVGVGGGEAFVASGAVGTGSPLPLNFYAGGSQRITIGTNGDVGIGTSARLTVRADGSLWTDANTQIAHFCRAWVNFDGTLSGTIPPRGSRNISSVVKNGTGDYTLNFINALPDANYSTQVTCNTNTGANQAIYGGTFPGGTYSTTAVRISVQFAVSGGFDTSVVCAAIFR